MTIQQWCGSAQRTSAKAGAWGGVLPRWPFTWYTQWYATDDTANKVEDLNISWYIMMINDNKASSYMQYESAQCCWVASWMVFFDKQKGEICAIDMFQAVFRSSPTTLCPPTSSRELWGTVGFWLHWQLWRRILTSFADCLVIPKWISMASIKLGWLGCWDLYVEICWVIPSKSNPNRKRQVQKNLGADVHLKILAWSCTKEIKCFKNGRPTSVVVDDFFPCSPNSGLPCYAHVDVQGESMPKFTQLTQWAEIRMCLARMSPNTIIICTCWCE